MKKLNLTVLLTLLMSMVGTKASAHDIEVKNADGVTIYYNFINDSTELQVTYQGSDFWNADYAGEVVIPESVTHDGNTYSVTAISEQAFRECSGLTMIVIPNSVTTIGVQAFESCTGLIELTIPASVTSINSRAFAVCRGLEKITVEEGNLYYDSREDCNAIIRTDENELIAGCKNTFIPDGVTSIGNDAFYACWDLTEITIPSSVISIGDLTFANCGLANLTLGSNVTSIGWFAFDGCKIKELTIPASVTSIGEGAFYSFYLEKITVEEGNLYYDSREDCNAIIRTDENRLIKGCKNSFIPDGITSIGSYAFQNCRMTELAIPNSVTSIDQRAFSMCGELTEFTVPNNVTSIGDYAFEMCGGLNEITIGSNVTSIGRGAFMYCSSFASIISLNPIPPVIESSTFDGTTMQEVTLYVPEGSKPLYEEAEYWKNFFNIQESKPTAIDSVTNDLQKNNTIYTLDGMKLNTTNPSDLPNGIYIVDGKKVVVK